MKIIHKFALLFVSSFMIISCSHKKTEEVASDCIKIELRDSSCDNLISEPQFWHFSPKRLIVLFGYGFNEREYVQNTIAKLENKYGESDNGGLLCSYIFPDSFIKSRRFDTAFYAELTDSEKDVEGVILLGAPDYTNRALGKNIDFWKQEVPYTVVSLFPQDDISGMQGTCDLVIDKTQVSDIAGNLMEEEGAELDYSDIIEKTLDFVLACESSLPLKDKLTLKEYAQIMLPGYSLHAYIDPETGIQFKNHFIIE